MSKKYTFVEGPFWVPLLAAIGLVVGLYFSSNGFEDLAYLYGPKLTLAIVSAVGGALVGWLVAIGLRRII